MKLIFIAFIASTAYGQLQQCTSDQLAGDTESFSISGGGGVYEPGSTQEVSWVRPSGSPVRRIRANVTIIDTESNLEYPPTNITNVPVNFPPAQNNNDLQGDIEVTLPANIPDGSDYVFRVTLRSKGTLCYLDTANFTVQAETANCTPGAMVCTSDLTGFQQCVETDATNTTFAFGDPIDCAAFTSCSQVTNSTIACAPVDECTLGEHRCVEPDSSQVCVMNPLTDTTVWGDAVPCEDGFSCNPETGVCEPDVVNECTLGETECVTETSNRVCLQGENGTVWSPPAECPPNNFCEQATGLCTSTIPPGSDCVPNSQVCLSDTTYDMCIHNENGVWSMGGVTLNCPENTVCEHYQTNGNVTSINCVPVTTTTASVMRRFLKFPLV